MTNASPTRDDITAIEADLAEAAEKMLQLDHPAWKMPGARRPAPTAEERAIMAGRMPGLVHSPAGADLDVIDFLAEATRRVDAIVAVARIAGGATAPAASSRDVAGAADRLKSVAVASLPADALEEIRAVAHELRASARNLLGWGPDYRRPLTACPHCRRVSVMALPNSHGRAVCTNSACVDDGGGRHAWDYIDGLWEPCKPLT